MHVLGSQEIEQQTATFTYSIFPPLLRVAPHLSFRKLALSHAARR